jgi:hypothetical protein
MLLCSTAPDVMISSSFVSPACAPRTGSDIRTTTLPHVAALMRATRCAHTGYLLFAFCIALS